MTAVIKNVLEMLEDDMVSHGLIAQCLTRADSAMTPTEECMRDSLIKLLMTGNVEIGVAKMTTPDYVEFVAWNGTAEERVDRAIEAVAMADGPDKEFAYWLCLRQNVDRHEEDDE